MPPGLAKLDPPPLVLNSSDPTGAPNIRIPSLPEKVHGAVPNVALDLLRIGAFVHWADQMVSRPVDIDVSGEHWKRSFVMVVPVLELDVWRQAEVGRALTRVLRYGTDDEWDFRFEQATPPDGQPYLFEADLADVGEPHSVLLFSGGTDSLCAAIEEATSGRRPMLVSHSPSPRAKLQQTTLRQSLEISPIDWHFPRYSVEVNKRGISEKERTQRSRGFLYSSIGASVAAGFRLRDVVLADNGFVSVGLPLNGQTVGAKMSRTTHPRFQYLFNQLCALVLPTVRIRNPLLHRTRAEALEVLSIHGLQTMLRDCSSCAAAGRLPAAQAHCGVCSQCLDRRIGVLSAGLVGFDTKYQTDVFLDGLSDNALLLAESYVRLMRKVESHTADELVREYIELTDCAIVDVGGTRTDVEAIVEMVRRQATTAQLAIGKAGEPVLRELFSGKYPTTCLVRLSLSGSPERKRKNWEWPDAAVLELTAAEEAAFARHHFNGRLPIVLTGVRVKRSSNVLEIDGRRIEMADAELVLLLRLVLALHKSPDGFVPKGGGRKPGGLASEDGVVPGSVDQAIERLRRTLQLGSGDLDPKNLIEVAQGRVRLSTHLRYVTLRREELSKHLHPVVQRLLYQIPAI